MNKLIKLVTSVIVGAIILYAISMILAIIVMGVLVIARLGYGWYKSQQRYTDWAFKFSRQIRESDGTAEGKYFRVQHFERFDRKENKKEEKQIRTFIPIDPNLGLKNSLDSEWIFNGVKESKMTKAKVRRELGF